MFVPSVYSLAQFLIGTQFSMNLSTLLPLYLLVIDIDEEFIVVMNRKKVDNNLGK